MKEKPATPSANQSAEKALRIMEYLSLCRDPARLMDIADDLKLNVSTTLRFINSLQKCGYVVQDPETQRYYLTFKICRIANQQLKNMELYRITHPFLQQLSNYFDESACISIERNMMMVYVDVATSPSRILMGQQFIGNAVPMHCTGNGKLILQQYSDDQLNKLIAAKGLTRYTDHTITTKEALLDELEKIRKRGYAIDNEECEIGARCVACPICDYTGNIIAGVSITGPSTRITMEVIREKLHFIRETADQISQALGY